MPITLRVMSWNIQKKRTNATYLAEMMRARQIDICVLLEVPNKLSFTIPFSVITALNNLGGAAGPHFANQWTMKAINVGNEAVVYIWHQTAAVGNNAFRGEDYANSALPRAGKVVRNAANQMIYFPTTNFRWANVPGGRPQGRRPAYMSFLTNDGAVAGERRFTVLNLHTPFNINTMIQSYATHLYASSREIMRVQQIEISRAAGLAALVLPAALAATVDPEFPAGGYIQPQAIRQAAVNGALAAIQAGFLDEGADLTELLALGLNDGVNAAVKAIGVFNANTLSLPDATALTRAVAAAVAGATVRMLAEVQTPNAPLAATVGAQAALDEAMDLTIAVVSQYAHPANRTRAKVLDSIRNEAKRMARVGLAPFVFPPAPLDNVNASIIAGDFNVDLPDATGYNAAAQNVLGNGNNAYTAMIAVAGAARINATTTRTGPTAFESQRVYTLQTPTALQNHTTGLATYVPINLATENANPHNFMGNASWVAGLKALPRTVGWNVLTAPPYEARLGQAFNLANLEVINDTAFYRTSRYDNIFLRGGTFVSGGMVDMMSALGSWPARAAALPNPSPVPAANPWLAATGELNALAQAQLTQPNANLQFTYSGITYTITPAIADAEEAAVFFDRFLSDHLPVAIVAQI